MSSNRWSLVSVDANGREQVAIQRSDGSVVLHPRLSGCAELVKLLAEWGDVVAELESLDPSSLEPVDARLLGPLRHPPKVLCSGPNFTDHLAEMGESTLGDDWTPYFFMKPPTTAVTGPDVEIPIPSDPVAQADWEGELAVIIGVGGRHIPLADALDHVAGYSVCNDISLRGPHRRPSAPAPFQWDWVASKGADGSLPIGPGMVPRWLVDDPQDLEIVTTVNDEVMQNGSTSNMVVDVAGLVSAASSLVTLEPGDVIATGTPAGVGAGRGVFLRPGDVVTVDIPGIGTLTNSVVAEPS